jgi:hypothetical protein
MVARISLDGEPFLTPQCQVDISANPELIRASAAAKMPNVNIVLVL